ncbi:lipase family protein [Rhodopirellula europaea]|uniref:Lipase, class 3 n=1 Tax=Rhodopirellula europaea 6C TaxID=1263867 RepID=M2AJ97_9BACT|nr:lipase family protein [Rhodopirellula europaea]EMB17220.1 Lipase, class 3 [Rhodopirellula europaea 6C]
MNLLTSNAWPIFVLFSIVGCIGFYRLLNGKPAKNWFGAATALGLLLLIAGAIVANSTPGGIDVIDDDPWDIDPTPPVIIDTEVEKLRHWWDSEGTANWPASEVLAEISEVAYETPVDAGQTLRGLGFDTVKTVESNTMLGYVAIQNDVAVIAFRGSENQAGDWLTNISRAPTRLSDGDVHSGFWSRYQTLKPQIETALRGHEVQYLWVTGHSLGGALALCCAHDFDADGRQVAGVMTFGQPMIARQSLADHIDDQLFGRYARFVNNDDFVARIPPSYRPCGRLVWFTPDGLKRSPRRRVAFGAPGANDDTSEIAEIIPATDAELQRWLADKQQPTPQYNERGEMLLQGSSPYIADHSMVFYIEKVLGLLKRQ